MIPLTALERWLLFAALVAVLLPVSTSIGPVGIAPFMIPLAGLYVVWFFRLVQGASIRLRPLNHFWPIAFVALLVTASSVASGNPLDPELTIWLGGLGLMLYSCQEYGRIFGLRFAMAFLGLAMVLELGVAVLQFVTQSNIGKVTAYFGQTQNVAQDVSLIAHGQIFRPVGTIGVPNLLGTWLVMPALMFYAALRWRSDLPRTSRWLMTALVAATVVMLVASTSRANLGVMLLAIVALEMLVRLDIGLSRRAVLFIGLGASTVALISVALVVVTMVFGSELAQLDIARGVAFRLANLGESLAFRLHQYGSAAAASLNFPFLGIGFGHGDRVWNLFEISVPDHFKYRPHNIYIILALEGGLLAALIFTATMAHLMIQYLRRFHRHDWSDHAVWVVALVLLTLGLVYITPISRGLWPFMAFWLGMLMNINSARGVLVRQDA